jgi:NOL1/NOP2/sun family putative RNA methylase
VASSPAAPNLARLERYRAVVDDFDAFVEANLAPEPITLRFRPGLTDPARVQARLEAQGFELAPVPGLPQVRKVVSGPHSVAQTLEHWLGELHVQQSVMAVPSLALAPRPGERVLDLCAAPGGKTSHLAELMEERGCLVAVDPKEKRLRGLMANLFRLGHANVLVVAADGRELPEGALFDRVLVDAPCSAEGNFRRTRGKLPKRDGAFVRYVTALQEALLRRAVELVRPGGTVVYSTCTWAPEENEAVVARVLETMPVEVEPIALDLPHAPGLSEWNGRRYPESLRHAWRLYPQHLDSGGAFVVRLRKEGGQAAAAMEAPPELPGWSPIPRAFPGEDPAPARQRIEAAVALLREGFGVSDEVLAGLGWMARAENLWLQTAGEWPVPAWQGDGGYRPTPRPSSGGWRVVSLGLRAFREASGGFETPSTALLTRLAAHLGGPRSTEVSDAELRQLLARERIPRENLPRGPVAVRWNDRVLGRGMHGTPGLELQVPRSQAERLSNLLEGAGALDPSRARG